MKVLSFDVGGPLGIYRRPYTTTSPLTYSFPPRTALVGLIGAIMGISAEDLETELSANSTWMTVRLINPPKKIRIPINLVDTKIGRQGRTQIRHEFLREPKFRVYVHSKNERIFNILEDFLKEGLSHFTPYLGQAQCLAKIENYNIKEMKEITPNGSIPIHSVIPQDIFKKLSLEKLSGGLNLRKEDMPYMLDKGRTPMQFRTYIFEADGRAISLYLKDGTTVISSDDENIVWM